MPSKKNADFARGARGALLAKCVCAYNENGPEQQNVVWVRFLVICQVVSRHSATVCLF